MPNFLSKKEMKLSKEFEEKGYIKRNIPKRYIKNIQEVIIKIIKKELKIKKKIQHKFYSK